MKPNHNRRGRLTGNKPHVCLERYQQRVWFQFLPVRQQIPDTESHDSIHSTPGYANPGDSQPFRL